VHARWAGRRLVLVRRCSHAGRWFVPATAYVLEIVEVDPREPVLQALVPLAQSAAA
jgi:hypothetical protein